MAVSPALATGGEDMYSSTSLKNLGSKIVKGLGSKKTDSTTYTSSPSGPQDGGDVGGGGGGGGGRGGKVPAGGVGFMGSMLGEVLVSYSTSTLPPSKRHSINAASAHFEELAAEAGVDFDVDEINMEDLRMYRLEEESAYALDDDSDGDNVGYNNMADDANAANQKLAHKERSILQMVEVLSDRLTSLNAVVINRYNGCKSDLDEATDFRSSRTKKMQAVVAEEDWSGATASGHKAGAEKCKRGGGGMFNQGGEGVGDGNHGTDPTARMTFRNAPQTDAGRKLAHLFEQEYGLKQVKTERTFEQDMLAEPMSLVFFSSSLLEQGWC